jgi:hypothetical protein
MSTTPDHDSLRVKRRVNLPHSGGEFDGCAIERLAAIFAKPWHFRVAVHGFGGEFLWRCGQKT